MWSMVSQSELQMTSSTTIKLSHEAKQKLDREQLPNETYEDTVLRLLGDTKAKAWTEQEIRQMAREEIESLERR